MSDGIESDGIAMTPAGGGGRGEETGGRLLETVIPFDEEDRAAETAWRELMSAVRANPRPNPREMYDRFTGSTPVAGDVAFEPVDGLVRGWWCMPVEARVARAAILYIHGGGYALGSAAGYRPLASQVVARTSLPVFALDYPLAPEAPFPAAFDAAVGAYGWLREQGFERVVVMGDSAGGALTLASVAHRVRTPQPGAVPGVAGCVVFSPWTDLTLSGATMDFADPVFDLDSVRVSAAQYLGGSPADDPQASPLFEVPRGMPPIYIQVGADEMLLADSTRYARAAAAQGAEVRLEIWEGMHHVFEQSVGQLRSAVRALDRVGEMIAGLL